jgi:hypothetical protein
MQTDAIANTPRPLRDAALFLCKIISHGEVPYRDVLNMRLAREASRQASGIAVYAPRHSGGRVQEAVDNRC